MNSSYKQTSVDLFFYLKMYLITLTHAYKLKSVRQKTVSTLYTMEMKGPSVCYIK